jgi:hypothetical protein
MTKPSAVRFRALTILSIRAGLALLVTPISFQVLAQSRPPASPLSLRRFHQALIAAGADQNLAFTIMLIAFRGSGYPVRRIAIRGNCCGTGTG